MLIKDHKIRPSLFDLLYSSIDSSKSLLTVISSQIIEKGKKMGYEEVLNKCIEDIIKKNALTKPVNTHLPSQSSSSILNTSSSTSKQTSKSSSVVYPPSASLSKQSSKSPSPAPAPAPAPQKNPSISASKQTSKISPFPILPVVHPNLNTSSCSEISPLSPKTPQTSSIESKGKINNAELKKESSVIMEGKISSTKESSLFSRLQKKSCLSDQNEIMHHKKFEEKIIPSNHISDEKSSKISVKTTTNLLDNFPENTEKINVNSSSKKKNSSSQLSSPIDFSGTNPSNSPPFLCESNDISALKSPTSSSSPSISAAQAVIQYLQVPQSLLQTIDLDLLSKNNNIKVEDISVEENKIINSKVSDEHDEVKKATILYLLQKKIERNKLKKKRMKKKNGEKKKNMEKKKDLNSEGKNKQDSIIDSDGFDEEDEFLFVMSDDEFSELTSNIKYFLNDKGNVEIVDGTDDIQSIKKGDDFYIIYIHNIYFVKFVKKKKH
jgi:hypothetical protein